MIVDKRITVWQCAGTTPSIRKFAFEKSQLRAGMPIQVWEYRRLIGFADFMRVTQQGRHSMVPLHFSQFKFVAAALKAEAQSVMSLDSSTIRAGDSMLGSTP